MKQVTKHTEDTHSKLHSKSFQSFSSRRNYFHGADNYYHLWVFDEFHEPEEQEGGQRQQRPEQQTHYVLDGGKCAG